MVKYNALSREQIEIATVKFCRALKEEGGATAGEAEVFERQMLALSGQDWAVLSVIYGRMADEYGRANAFAAIISAWATYDQSLSQMLTEFKKAQGFADS